MTPSPSAPSHPAPAIPTGGRSDAPARMRLAYRLGLLLLCSAYLQGGLDKAFDFPAAVAEMRHFGLRPAGPMALLTIVGELGCSVLVVAGVKRWFGAAYLALFTLAATFVANRFWEVPTPARLMAENGFFEHLGLVGAFLLVAWIDWTQPGLRRA
jgi:uncharacterized membrane protein YphA (DoxX/SURF4 family)